MSQLIPTGVQEKHSGGLFVTMNPVDITTRVGMWIWSWFIGPTTGGATGDGYYEYPKGPYRNPVGRQSGPIQITTNQQPTPPVKPWVKSN